MVCRLPVNPYHSVVDWQRSGFSPWSVSRIIKYSLGVDSLFCSSPRPFLRSNHLLSPRREKPFLRENEYCSPHWLPLQDEKIRCHIIDQHYRDGSFGRNSGNFSPNESIQHDITHDQNLSLRKPGQYLLHLFFSLLLVHFSLIFKRFVL